MKFKLKDISFENINFVKKKLNDSQIINIKYNDEIFDFQTPKVIINNIFKKNDREYISLKIVGNQACKNFFLKINEIESHFDKKLNGNNGTIKSIFTDDCFNVKISNIPKVYDSNGNNINYYSLLKGMEVICLLNYSKLWIDNSNEISYNLNVKEIMLLKN
jgi:hypothetical protein